MLGSCPGSSIRNHNGNWNNAPSLGWFCHSRQNNPVVLYSRTYCRYSSILLYSRQVPVARRALAESPRFRDFQYQPVAPDWYHASSFISYTSQTQLVMYIQEATIQLLFKRLVV